MPDENDKQNIEIEVGLPKCDDPDCDCANEAPEFFSGTVEEVIKRIHDLSMSRDEDLTAIMVKLFARQAEIIE